MNNKIEEDDLFTVEPQISYYSSSLNCGVTAIYSKNDKKTYKKTSKLFGPISPKNAFSLCNTIMIPFIINKSSVETDIINNNNKINHSVSIVKENDLNQNSLKIDNTRNKTFSSKGENKENDDSLNEKIIAHKDTINFERNPFFMGQNLSTNFINNNKIKSEEFNLKLNNEKIYESENNNSKNDVEIKTFMNREQCKSVNINGVDYKNSMVKEENQKDKSDMFIKKTKKTKIKESISSKKQSKGNKLGKKKSFFCHHEQSKSFFEEMKKESNKKIGNYGKRTNHSGGNYKSKNFYYSTKIINKNYNENFFKLTLVKKNLEKLNEKEKEKDHLALGKTERKKKKKGNKAPLGEININNKSIKLKFPKAINLKFKDKEKKDDSSQDSSISLTKVKLKNFKGKKLKIKKITSKNKYNFNKDSDTEEYEKEKTKKPNRRASGFSFKKKPKRRNSGNDNSEPKTLKSIKLKNLKDKDNYSKSQYSLLDNSQKNKINNSSTKKEDIDSLKNTYDEKDTINKITNNLRRKRSISMHLEISKIKEVAEAIKQKKPLNDTTNNSLSTTNTNNKIKKINKKKFDFESEIKKNQKKMQFNLFSKDKFTNTEFSDSDYLKYTLNCMELILEIDMEKQARLKNKINFNFPKPKKKGIKKKIALFDLDETLVHCTGDIKMKKDKYQHEIEIKLPGRQAVQVGINLRPFWKQTLNLIKKNYHIVIYTASHQAYADAVLDFMDPKKKYFKYRLYRNNCSLIDVDGAKFYVKDLDILNEYYDLKDIVIIDNSVLSFAFHLHNGIPIVPYYDEDKDGSLYVVGLYLIHIFPENDLREANKTQINLDSFLEEAKKQKEEDENIIDEEPDDEEDENNQNNNEKSKESIKGDESISKKDIQKNSGKNHFFNRKRTYISSVDNERRQSHDFTQKKLISQSKLINMYYEMSDESSKSIQYRQNKIRLSKRENNKTENTNNAHNAKNLSQEKHEIKTTDGGADLDCKSDPGNIFFNQKIININNINKNSDNDSNSEEEIPVLKRGYTINEDERNDKNNIKGKMKFIRSNFYNKFKI